MADPRKNLKLVTAVLLIVVAIVVGTALSKKHKHRERQHYDYPIYAIDSGGTIYRWIGHTPKWPVEYKGEELLPLYVCKNGHRFAGAANAMTTQCPVCGTRYVGAYDEDTRGPIDAVHIRNPSE